MEDYPFDNEYLKSWTDPTGGSPPWKVDLIIDPSECRLPFSGSKTDLQAMLLHARPPRLVGVDEQIADVVARCLEKT